MAKFQPGAIISEIRGSVGSDNYSRNRYGPIVRSKLVQPPSSTPRQVSSRQRFATAVAAWKALSESERQEFIAYAPQYSRTNSLGVPTTRSGYNLFMHKMMNELLLPSPNLAFPFRRRKPPVYHDLRYEDFSGSPFLHVNARGQTGVWRFVLYITAQLPPSITKVNPSLLIWGSTKALTSQTLISINDLWDDVFGGDYPKGTGLSSLVGIRAILSGTGDSGVLATYRLPLI